MLFNTTQFVFLFAAICLLYYIIPDRIRTFYLLVVSYVFYAMWNPLHVPFLFAMTLFTYLAGRIIEKKHNKGGFAFILVVLFAPLAVLKYYNFFAQGFGSLLGLLHIHATIPQLDVVTPIGLSFYSFMAGGYLIDVWKGKIKSERSLLSVMLFLSFFPAQVAGPISRAGSLIPQFSEKHRFNWDGVMTGLTYMLWGYVQKSVIGDNIKPIVDEIYGQYETAPGIHLLIAVFLYSMEIYCDFAGYSNLALGAGKVLGYDLIQNFDAPYYAGTVAGFWRRWHISLTKWFTDYIYIPLGGSRRGRLRQYCNIMIVFLVSGLWHGAGLNFVVWGALNGIYQIIGKITMPLRDKICGALDVNRNAFSHRLLKTGFTFSLISFSWIFFRMPTLKSALGLCRHIVTNMGNLPSGGKLKAYFPYCSLRMIPLLAFFILVMAIVDLRIYRKVNVVEHFLAQGEWLKLVVFLFLVTCVLVFGVYGPELDETTFIYAQF